MDFLRYVSFIDWSLNFYFFYFLFSCFGIWPFIFFFFVLFFYVVCYEFNKIMNEQKHEVDQGKKLYVARGNFFAAHSDKELGIALVGGLMNFCCGALGRSIMLEFEGPCTVYTQSRNPMDLKRMQEAARRAQNQQQNNGSDGGAGGDAGGE